MKNPPCKDCIVLAKCIQKTSGYSILNLINECCYFKDYLKYPPVQGKHTPFWMTQAYKNLQKIFHPKRLEKENVRNNWKV